MDRELIQRFEFSGFYDAKQHIIAYMNWYNERRRHREIGKMTPQQKWEEGLSGSVDKQSAQVAEEGLSRPTDTDETSINNQSLCISLDKPVTDTYFRLPTDQEKNTELHNQNLNSVQTIGG